MPYTVTQPLHNGAFPYILSNLTKGFALKGGKTRQKLKKGISQNQFGYLGIGVLKVRVCQHA